MSSIRIRQYTFSFPDRFAEGHRLTAGEASALNGLRAENIRNNTAKAVLDAIAALPEGEMLGEVELKRLQAKISAYAESYDFVQKHSPKPPQDLIKIEARAIARELHGAEANPELIDEVASQPEVIARARVRISTRSQIAGAALSELL